MKYNVPCKLLNKTECAYLAGIIDGEGCLRIDYGTNGTGVRKYGVTISVCNTHFGLIRHLYALTGVGNVFIVNKRGKRKPQMRWMIYSKQAEEVIKQILPYLIVKLPQAQILLEARKYTRIPGCKGLTKEEREKKHKLYLVMKKLNKRGI